jgi:hypothetical protein
MNCDRTQDLIWAFCEGALARDVSSRVEDHIRACAACRREVAAARETLEALKTIRTVGAIEPRDDFAECLRQKVDAWEARRKMPWLAIAGGFLSRNRRLLATSGMAFVVALFGGLYLLHNTFGPGPVPTTRTASAPAATSEGTGYEGIVPVAVLEGTATQLGATPNFVMREIPYDSRMVIINRPDGADTVYIRFPSREMTPPGGLQRDNYIFDRGVTPVSTSEPIY